MSGLEALRRRQELVAELRANGALRRDDVACAFLVVPRERFVPGLALEEVYRDQAITTKEEHGVPVSSSSQPTIMALMLEQLEVRAGMRVLEIGAGTGYNAALLQELVGEDGRVTSLEIDPEVAEWARRRLEAAGYGQVEVIQTDGGHGWEPGAPYDCIELTVGTAEIAPAWVAQLRLGGILVVPFWINTVQLCIAFEKGHDALQSRSIVPCGFTRIRGRLAGADRYRTLSPGLMIATGSPEPLDDLVRRLVTTDPRGDSAEERDWHGFAAYLALHERATLMVVASDEQVTGFGGPAFGLADSTDQSLCLLSYPIDGAGTGRILSYGGGEARRRIGELLEGWHRSGSPGLDKLSIALHASSEQPPVEAGAVTYDTGAFRLVARYASG